MFFTGIDRVQINPPSDDSKLKALGQPANVKSAESKPVSELTEIERPAAISELREHDTRNGTERRNRQRRKKQDKVLLDTRVSHERRSRMRREGDQKEQGESGESLPQQGIDLEA